MLVSFVGQEPVLFQGTIEENVGKGRVVNIHDTVMSLDDAMHAALKESGSSHANFARYVCGCSPYSPVHKDMSPQESEGDVEMGSSISKDC